MLERDRGQLGVSDQIARCVSASAHVLQQGEVTLPRRKLHVR